MNSFFEGLVTILIAIVGLATLAVIVSRNAQTSKVIDSGGNAFARMIGAAVSPVSGGMGVGSYSQSIM